MNTTKKLTTQLSRAYFRRRVEIILFRPVDRNFALRRNLFVVFFVLKGQREHTLLLQIGFMNSGKTPSNHRPST
eukprot:m.97136 g.97136  ORF g.97136 m.97136 type:complete len:74 (+) comp22024_c0_seq7:236-457(+)